MAPELGFIGVAVLILLLALRVPIAVSLGGVSLVGIYYMLGWDPMLGAAGTLTFKFVASWQLSAIPLFIFMGAISANSGLVASIYNAARLWLSGLPGGLAVATNFASAGFAAASGSSLATAAAMSRLSIPEMLRARYQPELASAVVAASGTLGSLIPPSILLIIYGLFSEQSIGDLLLAGVLPGLFTAAVYAVMIIVRCKRNPALAPPLPDRPSMNERMAALAGVWPLPLLILAVIGAIYSGLATATEAAAMGCIAALIIALLMRRLTLRVFRDSIVETLRTTGMIFFIALGAVLFTKFLALSGMPGTISSFATSAGSNPVMLLIVIGVIYLFLGMFLDPLGVMLLTLPIFLPLIEAARFDLIWFGVIVVKFIEIGLITPPVGLNAFVVKGAMGNELELGTIFRGLTWFIGAEIFIVIVLCVFPDIVTILPAIAN